MCVCERRGLLSDLLIINDLFIFGFCFDFCLLYNTVAFSCFLFYLFFNFIIFFICAAHFAQATENNNNRLVVCCFFARHQREKKEEKTQNARVHSRIGVCVCVCERRGVWAMARREVCHFGCDVGDESGQRTTQSYQQTTKTTLTPNRNNTKKRKTNCKHGSVCCGAALQCVLRLLFQWRVRDALTRC